ncbi:DUF4097 family beta strand repeat-containing protein [Oceanobacillus rekensis]|uniref:DUF4097 family beta strand repeat-containing protein n=1 Tax=Oceanobacillus rekensis TaxID=937927 RepID=UPI000B4366E3|nr:DUF4097 family beta strand repeat-containing protein [Oceanobacillus rekensis]
MLNVKKIAVIALVLLLVGVIGSIFTVKSVVGSDVKLETIEINDKAFNQIAIKTNNATVELLPTDDETTTVEFTGNRKNDQKYDVKADVDGNVLSITVKEKWLKFFNFDFSFSSPTLTVYVPEKEYETIQIDTDNGRAYANGLEVNEINVTTNNGRIELKDIKSTVVTSEADNGEIRLENVDGKLNGRTNNGKITLITEHLDHPIEFRTSNGRIHIQTENEPTNALFDVKVDNGKVRIFGDSNWDTVIGDGDNFIKLTTNNGGITVE